jgi:hypothetical protein
MGRASGRKNLPRAPEVTPDSGEGREIGLSARQDPSGSPIPGLTGNIANYETVRRPVPAGESLEEFRGMMAHGVPPGEETTEERARMERDGTLAQHNPPALPEHYVPAVKPAAVPVYITTRRGGPESYLTASPRSITVPSNNSDPVRVCGRNPKRNRVLLLNEDTATNIRFALRPSDLTNGGGALLPWPTNSYLVLETQDELFASTVSATLSVIMSVIEEFDQEL